MAEMLLLGTDSMTRTDHFPKETDRISSNIWQEVRLKVQVRVCWADVVSD